MKKDKNRSGASAPREASPVASSPTGATEATGAATGAATAPARGLPLSVDQQAIWVHWQVDPDRTSHILHMPLLAEEGELDLVRVRAATRAVGERFPMLRARVVESGEEAALLWDDAPGIPVTEVRTDRPRAETVAHHGAFPFDLRQGPLARVQVLHGPDGTVLLIDVHHLVFDGAACGPFLAAFRDAYAGKDLGPADDTTAHAEFARRQHELTHGPQGDTHREHWRRTLGEDLPDPLRMPGRPGEPAFHEAVLDPDLLAATRTAAAAARVHPMIPLYAAFCLLLRARTGQDDLIVPTPYHGRSRELGERVGYFSNVLPLRHRLPAGVSHRRILRDLHHTLREGVRHGALPYPALLRAAGLTGQLARTHAGQVNFQYWPAPPGDIDLTAIALDSPDSPGGTAVLRLLAMEDYADHTLTVMLREDPRGSSLIWKDPTGAVGRATVEELAAAYPVVLAALIADLDATLGEPVPEAAVALDRPSPEASPMDERAWNTGTDAGFPDVSLPGLLRTRATATPDAVALSHGARRLTYAELTDRAATLARGLAARGVRPGDLVALLLPRGVAQVEAVLATLFAGAVYVPLDVAVPAERHRLILEDSQAVCLVTDGRRGVPGFTGPVIALDELRDVPEGDLPETDPGSPAYVIFTSGTTGRPKGVVITHRNVVRLVVNDKLPYTFGPGDVWTMFHSYAFDVSVWEMFGCFAHGGRLVVVGSDEAQDPQRLLALLRSENVTVLSQTPSAFAQLTGVHTSGQDPLDALRYVIFAGEKLDPGSLAGFAARHPRTALVNMYGITEVTVHTTFREVTAQDIGTGRSNIGEPLPTTTLFILGPDREPLPAGETGEIWVGGLGVAVGYLNRPELTAERFLPNPFGEGTLYRSGDLARRLPDGTVEYVGRADQQVKIRGYRIEPGEIENRLLEHPAVEGAVVLAEAGPGGEARLVAYLLPHGTPPTTASLRTASLRGHLAARLPAYMVPARFLTVAAFPLTVNGKTDTRRLRETGTPLETGQDTDPPRTATARAVAEVWSDLLKVRDPGAGQSFFELGGHSLLAARTLRETAERLGGPVPPLRTLFDHPVLQDFADALDRLTDRPGLAPAPAPVRTGGPLPASGFQQRIWFDEQFLEGGALYQVPMVWRVRGRLDPAVLRTALHRMTERNEILRTAFVQRDGALWQEPGAPWQPEVDHQDLTATTGHDRDHSHDQDHSHDHDQEVTERLRAAARQPVDPASGRLLRVTLFDLPGEEQLLLLNTHHLVWDGGSAQPFLCELADCYAQALDPHAPPPAPRPQFRDALSGRAAADVSTGLGHWAARLDGAPAHPAFEPPATPGPHGRVPVPLPAELPRLLGELGTQHGVSPAMVFAAALAAALHGWTGQDDVTFGTPVAGRTDEEHAEVIGPLLNTAVLRSTTHRGETLGELLGRLRDTVLDAIDHQDVPFEDVVERLNPPRLPGRSPYVEVMLAVESEPPAPVLVGPGQMTPYLFEDPETDAHAKFALTVDFREQDGRFTGHLAHRGDRISAEVARAFAGLLGRTVEALCGPRTQRVDEVPTAGPGELARITAFEKGAPAHPATTLPALLAERISQRPGAPAVESSRGVLHYGELHTRALRLSARIRTAVQDREPIVAVVLGRGPDLVTAMLATWYAGCAFCPIDPDYPDERVRLTLKDVAAGAVVTEPGRSSATGDVPVLEVGDPSAYPVDGPLPEPHTPTPESPAYVLYTSGTTGRPKGAVLSHHGLAQLALWHMEAYDITPEDRASHLSSVGFDATQWEIWPYLAAGACVVAHDRRVVVPELAPWLAKHRITMTYLSTPVAEAVWGTGADLPALRWMLFAAAAQTRRPPTGLGYRVANNYGPTEGSVVATWQPGPMPQDAPLNVVGRPITGKSVYVVDPAGRRCPIGVTGELLIGGVGIALEYRGNPELTRERFLPAGPGGAPGPVYRTGDRARWREDGTLEFLGRVDRQLKVRGHRIEPQEVEAGLLADPRVLRAYVSGDATTLVAHVVPAAPDARDSRRVLEALAARLPAHLVPDALMWLDELPTTAHGKVDVARLPRPGRDDLAGTQSWVEPADRLEQRIAAVWATVLDLERVGAADNFFDLGGNSLKLATLHARLLKELDREIPVHRLFEFPTVRRLARFLAPEDDGPATPSPAARDDIDARAARWRTPAPRQSPAAHGTPRRNRNS
ncbi:MULTISPECIES: amino acid adenylation domain-containing protein [unclassified Streptomyces]|uniref:amino acid adenylation domain-containing protein n=1 Tax=unclassified Streptomyces TaxID=2593676 RepID=UPI003814DAC7